MAGASFHVLSHLSDMSHLSQVSLTMKKYDPSCIEVQVTKTVLISHNALLFWVRLEVGREGVLGRGLHYWKGCWGILGVNGDHSAVRHTSRLPSVI